MSSVTDFDEITELIGNNIQVLEQFRLRTITMGVNLVDCIDSDMDTMLMAIGRDMDRSLNDFKQVIGGLEKDLGVELLQTRRVTVTPLEYLGSSYVKRAREAGVPNTATQDQLSSLAKFIDDRVTAILGTQGVSLGGAELLGASPILDVGIGSVPASGGFVRVKGRIPAPVTSFRN